MNYSYSLAEKILFEQKKLGIQLGLNRFKHLLEKLKNPQKKFKAIHVAGTNGKGSVCVITESILKQAGYKTGLYTSPHLFEYRERIRLNSKIISKKSFCKYFFKVLSVAKKLEKKSASRIFFTEFELLTATAFLCFAENKIQIAVLETGLGGRLDATNLCKPFLTVLTKIGYDHEEFLGKKLSQIAREKAGIIKKNTFCVTLPNFKELAVIKKIANQKKARLFFPEKKEKRLVDKYFSYLTLQGEYQKENLALVFKIIEIVVKKGFKISKQAIIKGLENVYWPGRFQEIHKEPVVIIDGAHNPQAGKALRTALSKKFGNKKIIFVVGILRRKNYKGIIDALLPIAEKFLLIDKLDEPAWSVAELGMYIKKFKKPFETFSGEKFLKGLSQNSNKIFCFTGSLKTVKKALEFFR